MLSEELKAPKAVLVVEILPLDIRIKKLFTAPEYLDWEKAFKTQYIIE